MMVTMAAERPRLDLQQRNDLVQKAATFVYGIAAHHDDEGLTRYQAPVCLAAYMVVDQGSYTAYPWASQPTIWR
jgi:hypothetical protein